LSCGLKLRIHHFLSIHYPTFEDSRCERKPSSRSSRIRAQRQPAWRTSRGRW
jgi:hypothetical protein